MRGYSFNEYLKVKMKFSEIDKRDGGIMMIENGRVDFLIDNFDDINEELKGMKVNKDIFGMSNIALLKLYYGFANNPNGKELQKIWDTEFPKYLENGKVKELFKKYDKEKTFKF